MVKTTSRYFGKRKALHSRSNSDEYIPSETRKIPSCREEQKTPVCIGPEPRRSRRKVKHVHLDESSSKPKVVHFVPTDDLIVKLQTLSPLRCTAFRLEVFFLAVKGRCVRTLDLIESGQFVCEYSGELIPEEVARERERKYQTQRNVGCFMFFFRHRQKNLCIDATMDESGKFGFGRLMNHSSTTPNLQAIKVVDFQQQPRLCFVSNREILPYEELVFDYGYRDKEISWLFS